MAEPTQEEDRTFRPRPSGDPYWNESAFFSLAVPERLVNGFVYFWFRPNMGMACGGPAVWDPSGEHAWDCLYYDWDWPQAIPAGAEMMDFALPNGLAVECVEPFETYLLRYDRNGCTIDLRWDGVAEPHDVALGSAAPGLEEAGHRHYEQLGRMSGTVRTPDTELDVDCFSMRDRSWGPRQMAVSPRGGYLWAAASPDHAFHAIAVEPEPDADHDRVVAGFLLRDGRMADLVSGRRSVVERAGPRPAVVQLEARDALGRELRAEGRPANWFEWQGYGHQFQWWCLTRWDLDGEECWGEDQEFYPVARVRRHFLRSGAVSG